MKVFLLEDISPALAKSTILQLEGVKNQEPIEVVIFSQGGDVMAGHAIIRALKNTGSHITTNVIGLAASMSAVISQIGDRRVIAEDASFNIHQSAMEIGGERPTKEAHSQAARTLAAMDEIMVATLSNDTISKEDLTTLMSEDILLTAREAVALGFFDAISAPVQAVAILNKSIKEMNKLQTIMSKINLSAVKLGLISAVLTDDEAARMAELEAIEVRTDEEEAELAALRAKAAEEETEAPPESGAEILTSEMVTREEFDAFRAESTEMLTFIKDALETMPSTEETEAMVTTQTTAKLDTVLKAIKSKTVIPSAKQNFEQPKPTTGLDMNIINARVKRIKETSKQN